MLFSATLDKSACSAMSSVVFADLFGGISGELLLLGLSPRFPLMISGVPLLEPSRVKTKKTLGDKSFQVAAPGLWNKLPSEIRAIRSYDHFKRAIKTYLFKKAFACYS